MLVSFIVVAYNAEGVIKDCLKSLKNQDYNHKDIEVILVDSNSLDDTKSIMEKFKKEFENDFSRIVVLDNPKKTLPCGWNVALSEVKGEAILRVDAHTIYPNNFISSNVSEIEAGEDIVGGECTSITKNNTWIQRLLLAAENSVFGCGIADFRRNKEKKYVSTLAFAMYRKKVFDTVGKYNEKLARTEDNEMHYRMKKAGFKFLLSPNIKTCRYARSDLKGMMRQKFDNGKWIGITLKECPKCFSIYHFAPLCFVIALIICSILAIIGKPLLLFILLGLYTIFNVMNLIITCINDRFKLEYLLLPFVVFLLHVSYGVGTLVGIFKRF